MTRRRARVAVDISVLAHPHTGIARYLENMLVHMLPRGGDLQFFLYSSRPVEVRFGGDWRLRIQEGIKGTVGSYWIQQVCPDWMWDDGIDIFWGQNYLLPLRLRRPCRRVLTLHDITGLLMPWTMPARRRLNVRLFQRKAARCCDCLVAVSEMTGHLARHSLGVELGRIRVILEGCDNRLASLLPEQHPSASGDPAKRVRERFSLEPGFLLAVSTVEPRKDYRTLFRAVRQLPAAPPLVVAGGVGWRAGSILRELESLQAAGRVRYLGRVEDDELADLYRAASLLVYPSLYEGFGLPVLEAMTCGCPVVCSWSSSLPEVGGSAVRYFRPGDSEDLARVVEGVLRDPAELQAMRLAGLNRARQFSFSRAADEMLAVLRGQR